MSPFVSNLLAVAWQSAYLTRTILPYVLGGSLLAAFLLGSRGDLIPRRLLRIPLLPRLAACGILGTLSPLCTMGTVPVVAGLIGKGLPASAGIAFLTASSLANPQISLIAIGSIGFGLAFAQWLSAVGIACVAGSLAAWHEEKGHCVLHPGIDRHPGAGRPCHRGRRHERHGREPGFLARFLDQFEHVFIYVLIGVIATASLNVWMPGGVMSRLLDVAGAGAAAGGTVLSVPFYVCGGGILPLLGGLMDQGLAPGFVLAFIIAGPATRFQALAALAAAMNKQALAVYVVLIWFWAFAAGTLYNWAWG